MNEGLRPVPGQVVKLPSQQRTAEAAALLVGTRVLRAVLGGAIALLMAYRFGARGVTDAFFVAETIPLSLVGWLGPVLKVSLIPGLTELRMRQGREAEREASARLLGLSLPIFLLGTGVVAAAAPLLIHLLAPGFQPDTRAQAVRFTRLMAPALLLTGFFEFVECVLNTHRHFTWPSIGRLLAKLGMVGGLVFLAEPYGMPGVVVGILIGAVLQLVPQLPLLAQVAPGYTRPRLRLSPELRPVLRTLAPASLWLVIDQVNVIVDQIFASLLYPGKLSALAYAIRLVQFAINLLVGSLIAASLPSLAEHAAHGEREEARRLVGVNLRMLLFVTVPAMAGMVVLRGPLVEALLQRGHFDAEAGRATALALLGYTVGMASISINMVLRVLLFTSRRMGTVLRLGAFEIATHVVLNVILMHLLGHWGIALSTSLAATITTVLLVRAVESEFGSLRDAAMRRSLGRVLLATGAMSVVVILVRHILTRAGVGLPGGAVALTAVCAAVGALAFGAGGWCLRMEEIGRVRQLARWKRSRTE